MSFLRASPRISCHAGGNTQVLARVTAGDVGGVIRSVTRVLVWVGVGGARNIRARLSTERRFHPSSSLVQVQAQDICGDVAFTAFLVGGVFD